MEKVEEITPATEEETGEPGQPLIHKTEGKERGRRGEKSDVKGDEWELEIGNTCSKIRFSLFTYYENKTLLEEVKKSSATPGHQALSIEAGTTPGHQALSIEAGTAPGHQALSIEAGTTLGHQTLSIEAGTAQSQDVASDDDT